MRHVVPGLVVLSLVTGFGIVSNAYGAPPVSAVQTYEQIINAYNQRDSSYFEGFAQPFCFYKKMSSRKRLRKIRGAQFKRGGIQLTTRLVTLRQSDHEVLLWDTGTYGRKGGTPKRHNKLIQLKHNGSRWQITTEAALKKHKCAPNLLAGLSNLQKSQIANANSTKSSGTCSIIHHKAFRGGKGEACVVEQFNQKTLKCSENDSCNANGHVTIKGPGFSYRFEFNQLSKVSDCGMGQCMDIKTYLNSKTNEHLAFLEHSEFGERCDVGGVNYPDGHPSCRSSELALCTQTLQIVIRDNPFAPACKYAH
jgi:hypothetical protein